MKALEKDRNRRYETASAFAADVQRYLHDEPVRPARRRRGIASASSPGGTRAPLVAAAAAMVLLFVAGSAGWTLWDRATRQARVVPAHGRDGTDRERCVGRNAEIGATTAPSRRGERCRGGRTRGGCGPGVLAASGSVDGRRLAAL